MSESLKTTMTAHQESWPLAREFRIARGAKQSADVVVVCVSDGEYEGFGECVPYARYGESIASTLEALEGARDIGDLGPGAARNAWDCALWDLRAQQSGKPVWALAGLPEPVPVQTAFTVAIDTVEAMAGLAAEAAQLPLLKVKLGGSESDLDGARLLAIREAAPDARIIVDANEGWDLAALTAVMPSAVAAGVELIEQPLPAGEDDALAGFDSPIALGADESLHGDVVLEKLREKYQVVNIKLDKTGGLTHAIAAVEQARGLQFDVMIGCMVATSLSMAPALLLAPSARFVDLDGPLLLLRDREPALEYSNGTVRWPATRLWGQPAS